MGGITSGGTGTGSNGVLVTLSYNCNGTFKICSSREIPKFINLGISNKCCQEPTITTYVQDEYKFSYSIQISNLTPHYYGSPCLDPPGWGCNTCPEYSTWNHRVNFDTSPFVSVAGTFKQYDGSMNLLQTVNINSLSWFNQNYAQQEYNSTKWILDATFTTINGETVNIQGGYETNSQTCENELYIVYNPTVTNNIANVFTIASNCALFSMTLADGFYTIAGTYNGCMIVDCANDLDCQSNTYIANLVNSGCFECNKHEDLDAAMEMHMYQGMLAGCVDCCTKCMLYKKMINKLNKCTNC